MYTKNSSLLIFRSLIVTVIGITLQLLLISATFAQPAQTTTQTATTQDGKTVILKSDGTWQYSRAKPSGDHWKQMPASIDANSIVFDWQGGMYVVGVNNEMYVLDARANKWEPIYPGVKVKSITVEPDGTVIAPDTTSKFIYSRVNGKWTKTDGYADQIVAAKDGKTYALTNGTITESGGFIKGSSPSAQLKFKYMSAPTKTNGLYLVDITNKVHTYDPGTGISGEIVGGGKAKVICGTGYGVRAGQFINGAGNDNNTYFFEVSPQNKWVPVESQTYVKFIALNPVTNVLYGVGVGVGVDNKLYSYVGTY